MSNKVNYVPAGYAIVTPYLTVPNASEAIQFYEEAFGATERSRLVDPDGKIIHAEIAIGEGIVMLADEFDMPDSNSPLSLGGTPVRMSLFVPDVDAFAQRAMAAGAKLVIPISEQFYGERTGRLEDPYGHLWIISTHIEDVTPDEMQRRFDEMTTGS
ncbi:MAG: VOC family protein [Chloroflexota bacterium]